MDRLKGKTILIGKEPGQGRLLVSVGGKTAAIGAPGSVPGSVSRCMPAEGVAHAKIAVDQQGNMVITNIKAQNVTFVNGAEVASKRLLPSAVVELGKDRFNINLPVVLDTAEKLAALTQQGGGGNVSGGGNVNGSGGNISGGGHGGNAGGANQVFNITHLKRVWDTYEGEMDRIAKQQEEMGKKRMLPIMVGSLSGVASPLLATLVAVNTLYFTVPVAAVSFGLYFMNYRKKDTSYEERKAANDRLTDEYVCPNPDCNKFLGYSPYKLLKKQYSMQCPYCKSKFVEK